MAIMGTTEITKPSLDAHQFDPGMVLEVYEYYGYTREKIGIYVKFDTRGNGYWICAHSDSMYLKPMLSDMNIELLYRTRRKNHHWFLINPEPKPTILPTDVEPGMLDAVISTEKFSASYVRLALVSDSDSRNALGFEFGYGNLVLIVTVQKYTIKTYVIDNSDLSDKSRLISIISVPAFRKWEISKMVEDARELDCFTLVRNTISYILRDTVKMWFDGYTEEAEEVVTRTLQKIFEESKIFEVYCNYVSQTFIMKRVDTANRHATDMILQNEDSPLYLSYDGTPDYKNNGWSIYGFTIHDDVIPNKFGDFNFEVPTLWVIDTDDNVLVRKSYLSIAKEKRKEIRF